MVPLNQLERPGRHPERHSGLGRGETEGLACFTEEAAIDNQQGCR